MTDTEPHDPQSEPVAPDGTAPDASMAAELAEMDAAADTSLATSQDAPMPTSSNGPAFMGVPIEVTISVGKARPLVNELVKLRRDSVIGLDTKVDDPVEVYIGDKLIARGELEEMEEGGGQLAVRLTEVADIAGGS